MEGRMNKRHFFLFILLFIGLFIFAYRNLLGYGMLAMCDFPAFSSEGSKIYFTSFLSSWQFRGLGNSYGGPQHYFFLSVISFIFRDNALLAQKIFYLSLLPLAGIAMYLLAGQFTKLWFARFIAALLYAVNPVTIGQFAGGGPGILVTYTVLPALTLFSLAMIKKKERQIQSMFLFAFFLALASSFNPETLLIIAPILLCSFFINILIERDLKSSFRYILLLMVALAICFLLVLPYSLFAISFVRQTGSEIARFTGSSIQQLFESAKGTYSACSLRNLLKICGNSGAYDWWLGYGKGSRPWTIAGFVLPLFAFLSLLLIKNNQARFKYVITLSFSFLSILIIFFCWSNKYGFLRKIYLQFPILFAYRNPVKVLMVLPLAYASLIAITVTALRVRMATFTKINLSRISQFIILPILYLFFLVNMGIYSWPFFTGDMGISCLQDSYIVPPVYSNVSKWINNNKRQGEFFRILWLPHNHETHLRLYSDLVNFNAFNDESNVLNNLNEKYIKFVLNSLCNQETNRIGSLLAPASVKYIIVDLSSSQKGSCRYHKIHIYGHPKNFVKILNRQEDLKLIVSRRDFLIYENKKFIPHIALYEKAFLISSPKNEIPLSQFRKISALPHFHIADQLIVFKDQLSLPQKEWFLKNPHTVKIVLNKVLVSNSKSGGPRSNFYKIGPTEYRVEIKSEKPVFIILGESFHPSWNAYVNGVKLGHFPVFYWANGFYLKEVGENIIKITYEKQKTRDLAIKVWALSWISLILAIGWVSLKNK